MPSTSLIQRFVGKKPANQTPLTEQWGTVCCHCTKPLLYSVTKSQPSHEKSLWDSELLWQGTMTEQVLHWDTRLVLIALG